MKHFLLAFVVVLFPLLLNAQVVRMGNVIYTSQFPGSTVGARVTLAQNECSSDTNIPCYIVIDPIMNVFATGTMPTLLSHVFLIDYRSPSTITGISNPFFSIRVVDGAKFSTLQEAHDDLPADGGMILVPTGTYTGSLTISRPVHINCQGAGGYSINTLNSFLQPTILQNTSQTADLITIDPPAGAGIGLPGVVIENCVLLGNDSVAGATSGSNIVFSSNATAPKFIRNITIRNVWSRDAQEHGLEIEAASNTFQLDLDNFRSTDNVLDGIHIAGTVSQIWCRNCDLEFNGSQGIEVLNTATVTDIHLNLGTIASNTSHGAYIRSGHSFFSGVNLELNGGDAIRLENNGSAFVMGNTISHGANNGINIVGFSGETPQIMGNAFSGAGTSILIAAALSPVNIWPQAIVGTITDNSNNAQRYDLWTATGGQLLIPAGTVLGWSDANFNRVAPNTIGTNANDFNAQGFFSVRSSTLAALGAPGNGTIQYCSDCTRNTAPCTGAGSGSLARREGGAWNCD